MYIIMPLLLQEWDIPTHFIFHSTHDGRVSKDSVGERYAYVSFVLAGTELLEGKQQLSTIPK